MPAQQVAQLVANDVAADDLVIQSEIGQVVSVEEVSERPVPHVMQQGGQPHQRFDIAAAGQVGANLLQALDQGGRDRPAGQVHGAERVLKPRVLGRGIDPPGRLQLMDLPQPLHPGIVDDLLFGDLAVGQSGGRSEGDIAVNGVVAEAFVLEIRHCGIPPGGVNSSIMPGGGAGGQGPGARGQGPGARGQGSGGPVACGCASFPVGGDQGGNNPPLRHDASYPMCRKRSILSASPITSPGS